MRADMADPSTLSEAFRGVYGVYSVQNTVITGAEAEIQGKNVANAAREAGVPHVVYGSAGQGCRARVCRRGRPSWR